jgi:hypothetical protein
MHEAIDIAGPNKPRSDANAAAQRAPIAVLRPFDRLRAYSLKRLGKRAAKLFARRETRVAAFGSLAVCAALAGTLLAPLWMLALGPIAFGVPHLVSDVRYMIVRPEHHRRAGLWLWAGLPIAAAGLGGGVAVGVLGAAGACACARTSPSYRALGFALAGLLVAGCVLLGSRANLVFLHAHNAVAVLAWVLWRRRHTSLHWIVVGLFALGSAAIALGPIERWAAALPGFSAHASGLGWGPLVAELAPGVSGRLAGRLVLLFAFAQSVHYAIWLRLVPEEDRARPTPRTFSATFRALRADFGRTALWVAFALSLLLALWACADLRAARAGYLRLALFHGHMELAALCVLLLEGRLPWAAGRSISR